MDRLSKAIKAFEPRVASLGVARSGIAFASLTVLLFSPLDSLFIRTPERPLGVSCTGVRHLSLWCLTEPTRAHLSICRMLSVAVLLMVISGYKPRWTCIPHWYVSFSLAVSLTLPDGGEDAAKIATLLLIPVFLGDGRRWHWTTPVDELPSIWRGSAFAAWMMLRMQVTIVYFVAVFSKLRVAEWRDGTALYPILHDPVYVPPAPLLRMLAPLLESKGLLQLCTWGVLVIEFGVGLLILTRQPVRYWAAVLAIALHLGIIVLLGLVSFGLIMIAVVLAACNFRRTRAKDLSNGNDNSPIPGALSVRSGTGGIL